MWLRLTPQRLKTRLRPVSDSHHIDTRQCHSSVIQNSTQACRWCKTWLGFIFQRLETQVIHEIWLGHALQNTAETRNSIQTHTSEPLLRLDSCIKRLCLHSFICNIFVRLSQLLFHKNCIYSNIVSPVNALVQPLWLHSSGKNSEYMCRIAVLQPELSGLCVLVRVSVF